MERRGVTRRGHGLGDLPNCHILLVEAETNSFENLASAEQEAVSLGATEISNSWAGDEYKEEAEFDADFNHPGIPITVRAATTATTITKKASNCRAIRRLAVRDRGRGNDADAAGDARGWSESVWPRSGSGCSLTSRGRPSKRDQGVQPPRQQRRCGRGGRSLRSRHLTGRRVGRRTLADRRRHECLDADHRGGRGALRKRRAIARAGCVLQEPGLAVRHRLGRQRQLRRTVECTAGGGYDAPSGNGTPPVRSRCRRPRHLPC